MCPEISAVREGGPGMQLYTLMILSVPPVAKYLPPAIGNHGNRCYNYYMWNGMGTEE